MIHIKEQFLTGPPGHLYRRTTVFMNRQSSVNFAFYPLENIEVLTSEIRCLFVVETVRCNLTNGSLCRSGDSDTLHQQLYFQSFHENNTVMSCYSRPGLVIWAIARCRLIGWYVGLIWCSSGSGRLRFLSTGRFTRRWYVAITERRNVSLLSQNVFNWVLVQLSPVRCIVVLLRSGANRIDKS
jgi:hypothetical protein